ncbi:hypothetical protein [Chromobacterium sphagni]|nr:hypothetical protein [Chromobacterium sphagni]
METLKHQQQLELNVVNTTNLPVSTRNAGGIANITFVLQNANAVEMDAIF